MAYVPLHPIKQFDFQINRILTYGERACNFEEVMKTASAITDIPSWNKTWRELGHVAEGQKRYLHAGFYYRLAEFFLKESPEKEEMYQHSIANYWEVIQQDESVDVVYVPYKNASLKTFVFRVNNNPKGTILAFGGYDSFIEEFYLVAKDLLAYGYEIILFEGPGQGESLRKGLDFEPYWEQPVKAVLDYFKLEDVAAMGISWGGYLVLRAAAFEKRISKAIAFDVLYDGFDCMMNPLPQPAKTLMQFAFSLKAKSLINYTMTKLKKNRLLLDWVITHGQYITGTSSPYDFYSHLKLHTMKNILNKVDCDVLLLAGEKDHYIPKEHYYKLLLGLTEARSLHGRMFSEKEGGAEHCQIGNHQIAMDEIFAWLSAF